MIRQLLGGQFISGTEKLAVKQVMNYNPQTFIAPNTLVFVRKNDDVNWETLKGKSIVIVSDKLLEQLSRVPPS